MREEPKKYDNMREHEALGALTQLGTPNTLNKIELLHADKIAVVKFWTLLLSSGVYIASTC
jgi:hypothetical protein